MSANCTKVKLRRKHISNGRSSLYLDFYPPIYNKVKGRRTRREFLGLYIFDKPRESHQFEYNRSVLHLAEVVRCQRQVAIACNDLGFFSKNGKESFLDYFRNKMKLGNNYANWHVAFEYFSSYCNGKCYFDDLCVDFCQGFLDFMLSNSIKMKDKNIRASTANNYMNKLRCVLRLAYKENKINEDLAGLVKNARHVNFKREHLTVQELKNLANAPCESNVLKSAALFACLTGLRLSDVMRLRWENLEIDEEGNWTMHIVTKKTSTEAVLPLGKDAITQCGKKTSGIVFKGLNPYLIHKTLPQWLKKAGIDKHITFHSFRHTFATLQLAAGTDIYTISNMLTHSNITTTQIYVNVVSALKRDASNRIRLE